MRGNWLNIYRVNFIVIALMLAFLCVLPIVAQPTSPRHRSKQMTLDSLKELDQINSQIENDKSNVSLYKKRLQIYWDLASSYEDKPNYWQDNYADKYEADLSNIIKLEKTAWNYYQRGSFIEGKIDYLPVKNVSDLYPHNSYVDLAAADFLQAVQLASDSQEKQAYYASLSRLYSIRPETLLSALDFSKWKDKIPLELVRKDLEMSIEYSQLAVKAGAGLPYIDELKKSLIRTYRANADIAEKLGDSATALKYTQAAEKYRE